MEKTVPCSLLFGDSVRVAVDLTVGCAQGGVLGGVPSVGVRYWVEFGEPSIISILSRSH